MNAVGTRLNELLDGVNDLINRVADIENPEIRRENKSALVSLGSNKKGKPRLWIIQKIR